MVEFKSITKSYQEDFWKKPNIVLNEVNIKLSENKIIGFVGKNGSGKTTAIKVMLGLVSPNHGQVIYSDRLGINKKTILNNIGYMPENPSYFLNLSGRNFLNYMRKLHDVDFASFKASVNLYSEYFEMEKSLDRKISNYSKGMKQKIGFMSSIIHNPKFIILDEPLSGLDPKSRRDFKRVFRNLKEMGSTIFLTSHILEDLYEVSDEIIHMKNGKMIKGNIIDNHDIIEVILRNHNDYNKTSEFKSRPSRINNEISYFVKENELQNFYVQMGVALDDIVYLGPASNINMEQEI